MELSTRPLMRWIAPTLAVVLVVAAGGLATILWMVHDIPDLNVCAPGHMHGYAVYQDHRYAGRLQLQGDRAWLFVHLGPPDRLPTTTFVVAPTGMVVWQETRSTWSDDTFLVAVDEGKWEREPIASQPSSDPNEDQKSR